MDFEKNFENRFEKLKRDEIFNYNLLNRRCEKMINWMQLNVLLYRSTLDTACSRSNISTVRYGVC